MIPIFPLTKEEAIQYYSYIDQIITEVDTLPARGNLLRTIWDIVLRNVYMVITPPEQNLQIPSNFFKVRFEAVKAAYSYPELRETLCEKHGNKKKEISILDIFNNLQHCNDGKVLALSLSRYRFALRYLLNMISVLSGVEVPPYLLQSCKEIQLPKELKKPLSVTFIIQISGHSLQDNLVSAKVMNELQDALSTLYERSNVRKYLKNVTFNLYVYGTPSAVINDIQIQKTVISNYWSGSQEDNISINRVLKEIIDDSKKHVPQVDIQHKIPLYKQRLERERNTVEHKPLIFWLSHDAPSNIDSEIKNELEFLTSNHLIRIYPLGLSNKAMISFRKLLPKITPLRIEVTANLFSLLFDTISSL